MQIKYISYPRSRSANPLRKAVAFVTTLALAGLALMFSAVLLTVLLCVAVVAFALLWWKTRAIRKQMRARMQDFAHQGATAQREAFVGETFDGEVIEGEAIRVDEPRDRIAC
ncbi:MAG: hypothetical protein HYZ46_00055 [Nitrosomonadales bacterium]|nr:hypothetical protein [Nitrosomonadales bacterium]